MKLNNEDFFVVRKLEDGHFLGYHPVPDTLFRIRKLAGNYNEDWLNKIFTFDSSYIPKLLGWANLDLEESIGEDGRSVICREHIPHSKELRDWLSTNTPTEEEAIKIIVQVLEGLRELHEMEFSHSGLTPKSVLVVRNAEYIDVFITDLYFEISEKGVGQEFEISEEEKLIASFRPPELLDEEGLKNPVVDIYAAGLLFYFLLEEKNPFMADTLMKIVNNVAEAAPLTFSSGVSEEVKKIIQKATSKDPEDRYQTAVEMLDDLTMLLK